MNTRTQAHSPYPSASLTLRDWIDAMPIVILARAIASAVGEREHSDTGRRAAAQVA